MSGVAIKKQKQAAWWSRGWTMTGLGSNNTWISVEATPNHRYADIRLLDTPNVLCKRDSCCYYFSCSLDVLTRLNAARRSRVPTFKQSSSVSGPIFPSLFLFASIPCSPTFHSIPTITIGQAAFRPIYRLGSGTYYVDTLRLYCKYPAPLGLNRGIGGHGSGSFRGEVD